LEQYVSEKEIFTDYLYFSSYSDSWVEHARRYTEKMISDFKLTPKSHVVEIASNDGYLLQHFVRRSIPSLGIEPAANVAAVAVQKGIPSRVEFFGVASARALAAEGKHADLLLGNNVLAQVPDLNDFVAGMKILLKPQGVITMEFPHVMRLVEENQFDTIYHEHFSYFSLFTTQKIFAAHGLEVFHVEELSTHGGSLRVYAKHAGDQSKPASREMQELLARELKAGVATLDYYRAFAEQVRETKRKILQFLIEKKREGKTIVGYGAPGKGNTLLNYCGIRTDFLDYTVDRSPHKQGKFLPGTHIPILAPEQIQKTRPDYLFILPWNIKDEIMSQMKQVREWGGRFVVPIPEVKIYE
jgi:SAM-dependent methyltransferase